jgi:hypothetical protein
MKFNLNKYLKKRKAVKVLRKFADWIDELATVKSVEVKINKDEKNEK